MEKSNGSAPDDPETVRCCVHSAALPLHPELCRGLCLGVDNSGSAAFTVSPASSFGLPSDQFAGLFVAVASVFSFGFCNPLPHSGSNDPSRHLSPRTYPPDDPMPWMSYPLHRRKRCHIFQDTLLNLQFKRDSALSIPPAYISNIIR